MRRTVEQAREYINSVNLHLYESGNHNYYSVNCRNGYKALDKYRCCDACVEKRRKGTWVICNHDTLVENVGCYTTGELYEVAKALRNLSIML